MLSTKSGTDTVEKCHTPSPHHALILIFRVDLASHLITITITTIIITFILQQSMPTPLGSETAMTASASGELDMTSVSQCLDKITPKSGATAPKAQPKTLNADILPCVIAQLDPEDTDDLCTLLKIQRLSKDSWALPTPLIYRSITIRNWSALLTLPDGVNIDDFETPEQIEEAISAYTPAQVSSIGRQRIALSHIVNLRIHCFPIGREITPLFSLSYLVFAPEGKDLPESNSWLFAKLEHLEILPCAMDPFTSTGRFKGFHVGSNYGNTMVPDMPTDPDTPIPFGLGPLMQPKQVCLTLPTTIQGENVVDLNFAQFLPLFTAEDAGWAEGTGLRRALIALVRCFGLGTEVSIHEMSDLLLPASAAMNRHNRLYMRKTANPHPSVGPRQMQFRARLYAQILQKTTHIDEAAARKVGWSKAKIEALASQQAMAKGKRPVKSCRWTISEETLPEGYESNASLVEHITEMVDNVQTHLTQRMGGRLEEYNKRDENEDIGFKRMSFVLPGHRVPCPVCQRA